MADRYSWTNASDYSVGNADGVKGKLTQWNRSTVADGKWLNQETIVPMSGRDEYLLDSLNDLGGDFDSYTATTDTTLETIQDAIDTNADNIDTLNQVVANKQDKLGKNNQGYGINIYEAGDPDDPAAPTTIAAAPGNTSYIGYVDDGDGTLKYALSAEIGVKSIDAIGPDGSNIITGFDSIDSTEVVAETMQSTYIASTDEEVEKMETSEVLTLLSDTLTLEGSTSIDVNTDTSTAKTTVSLITKKSGTTNASGLVIDSDGVAVNPDNKTIRLSSGQVAANIDNQTILSKINGVDGLGVYNSSRFVYHTSDAAFTRSPVYTSLFHCNQTNLYYYNIQEMFKPNSLFTKTSVANSSLFTKTWPVNITDMTWDNTKNVYMWSQGSYLTLVDLSFNININWDDVVKIKQTKRCQNKHEVYLGRFTYSPLSAETLYLFPPAGKYTDARYLIDCSIVYPTAGYCCCIKGSESVPCSCNLNGGYYGLASHAVSSNGDTECWGDLYCCMNINDLLEKDITFIGNLTFNVLTTPGLVPQDDPNNPVIHYRYMK